MKLYLLVFLLVCIPMTAMGMDVSVSPDTQTRLVTADMTFEEHIFDRLMVVTLSYGGTSWYREEIIIPADSTSKSVTWDIIGSNNGRTVHWQIEIFTAGDYLQYQESGTYDIHIAGLEHTLPPTPSSQIVDHFRHLAWILFGFDSPDLNDLVVAMGVTFLSMAIMFSFSPSGQSLTLGLFLGIAGSFFMGLLALWIIVCIAALTLISIMIIGHTREVYQ